jgi:hypothetical protein
MEKMTFTTEGVVREAPLMSWEQEQDVIKAEYEKISSLADDLDVLREHYAGLYPVGFGIELQGISEQLRDLACV